MYSQVSNDSRDTKIRRYEDTVPRLENQIADTKQKSS